MQKKNNSRKEHARSHLKTRHSSQGDTFRVPQIQKSQALWKKAQKIVHGGVPLLSKKPERFLREGWPAYFSKAKGIEVTDIDGNKYLDFSYMGVGPNLLGYADPDVNAAVKRIIDSGNQSTLNSPEEVALAK